METKLTETSNVQQQAQSIEKPVSAGLVKKQPNVDTRFKTEDVTDRKGLEFKDFNLAEELMLVSAYLN